MELGLSRVSSLRTSFIGTLPRMLWVSGEEEMASCEKKEAVCLSIREGGIKGSGWGSLNFQDN